MTDRFDPKLVYLSGVGLTVIAIILVVAWIVLAQKWIIIPGIN